LRVGCRGNSTSSRRFLLDGPGCDGEARNKAAEARIGRGQFRLTKEMALAPTPQPNIPEPDVVRPPTPVEEPPQDIPVGLPEPPPDITPPPGPAEVPTNPPLELPPAPPDAL
jgi:hypothetical protein